MTRTSEPSGMGVLPTGRSRGRGREASVLETCHQPAPTRRNDHPVRTRNEVSCSRGVCGNTVITDGDGAHPRRRSRPRGRTPHVERRCARRQQRRRGVVGVGGGVAGVGGRDARRRRRGTQDRGRPKREENDDESEQQLANWTAEQRRGGHAAAITSAGRLARGASRTHAAQRPPASGRARPNR